MTKIGLPTGEQEGSVTPPTCQDKCLPDQCDEPRGLPALSGGRKSLSQVYKREVLQLVSGLPPVRWRGVLLLHLGRGGGQQAELGLQGVTGEDWHPSEGCLK